MDDNYCISRNIDFKSLFNYADIIKQDLELSTYSESLITAFWIWGYTFQQINTIISTIIPLSELFNKEFSENKIFD